MKRIIVAICCFASVVASQAQNNYKDGLIELGRAYKNYMFRSEPTKKEIKELKANNNTDSLKDVTPFIIECISANNKILKPKFLTLPDEHTLRSVYIVREISENLRKEGGVENGSLVDSLSVSDISREVLVDCYYNTSFTANGNKNRPFNLKKYNFEISSYNLNTDAEKGIFFLCCMNACGTQIWGFMNIPNPPNTAKAFELIGKFPKINGQEYFKYTDLYFEDFQFDYADSLQSYKAVYVHKYFDLLLNHLVCMGKEGKGKEAIRNLLLSSALKDEKLYKYTSHKTTLEQIFKK